VPDAGRRAWRRSDDAAHRDDEAVAVARAESGAFTAPEARQSLQDCSIDLTMTKIASMTPPAPRGKIMGERVGVQPVDEVDHFHQAKPVSIFKKKLRVPETNCFMHLEKLMAMAG